jgi:hypothetical protein
MKTKEVKVSELSGSALDWCVALAYYGESKTKNGQPWFRLEKTGHVFYHTHENGWRDSQMQWFIPSKDWGQGGPIIEREKISTVYRAGGYWLAYTHENYEGRQADVYGPTPLIASMRCFVASKMGDTVSIPLELLEV